MLGRRREVANQAEAGRANPAAAATAAATAGVVLASSPSQRHRVTESQTRWHCPAGEVARHRNTRPCQSSAGGAGSSGKLGGPASPRGQARTGAGGGAHRLSAIIRHPYHLFLSRGEGEGKEGGVGGRGQLGIGNQRGPSGWLAPETTNGLHLAMEHLLYSHGEQGCAPHSLPPPVLLLPRSAGNTLAHGWHANGAVQKRR